MPEIKAQLLAHIPEIRADLLSILDGMDYCLDWRPDPASWSAREVISHLLNTPPGGVPAVFQGVMAGNIREFDLWADEPYLTPEMQAWDIAEVRAALETYFAALTAVLESVTDDALAGATVMVHQRNRHWDEPRPAQWLPERLFAGHWREHLTQLRELRAALGV